MRRTPPAIDETRLEAVADATAFLQRAAQGDERVEDKLFQNATLEGADLANLALSGCVLRGCRLTGAKLRRSSLADCRFTSCELSGCDLSDSRLSRIEFGGCKLSGAIFAEGYLQDVYFADCVAPSANLAATRQYHSQLVRSNFSEADFTDCELRFFTLEDVDFSRASFFRTPLRGVDLAGCRIEALGVEASSRELRGARLDITQLAELAALLGIEIL